MTDENVQDVETQEEAKTIADVLSDKVMEITNCTQEQADDVSKIVSTMVSETVNFILNDHGVLQDMFTAMLRVQVNSNTRLNNILSELNQAEWILIDEEHHAAGIRVKFNGLETHEWIFERRTDDDWTPIETDEAGRTKLEVLAGKFFDGQVDRVSYIVDARMLEQ